MRRIATYTYVDVLMYENNKVCALGKCAIYSKIAAASSSSRNITGYYRTALASLGMRAWCPLPACLEQLNGCREGDGGINGSFVPSLGIIWRDYRPNYYE